MHSDLAPRNVFISRNEFDQLIFKVGDYGRCSYLADEHDFAGAGNYSLHGAPEPKTSFHSDVWALGVILFEVMSLNALDVVGERDGLKDERTRLRTEVAALNKQYGER